MTAWWQYLYPVAAGAVLTALWVLRGRIGRGPLAAVLSFLIIVAPTTGLFNFSYHLYSFVADHYQYHAAPALIALFAAGVTALRQTLRRNRLASAVDGACGALLLVFGALSVQHAQAFQSEKARCLHTLDRNPAAWVAMNNLGVALNAEGKHEDAARWYLKALEVNPIYAEAFVNLGKALLSEGNLDGAVRQFEEAVRLNADSAETQNLLGVSLAQAGRVDDAIEHFERALRINGNYTAARENLDRARILKRAPAYER